MSRGGSVRPNKPLQLTTAGYSCAGPRGRCRIGGQRAGSRRAVVAYTRGRS
jgi:hypothetical protein